MSLGRTPRLLAGLILASCGASPPSPTPTSAPPKPSAIVPAFAGKRPTMQEASERFASMGVQPGQPLPQLSLLGIDGKVADLAAMQAGRPLLLVACSLTCNVARRQQAAVAGLGQRFGEAVAVAMVYTIDAHPKGDVCPYSGEEWVPIPNERDNVLVRQPATIEERLALASRYAKEWAAGTVVLVDTMDNASWRALGEAPNVGLCVDKSGIVVCRTGWFDAVRIESALNQLSK